MFEISLSQTSSKISLIPVLDKDQKAIYDLFEEGRNVAILGSAGSGKSHVLSAIDNRAKSRFARQMVVACALTNQAATNMGGVTIHSLLGVPAG